MELKRVILVIVDISGYTRFMTEHVLAVLHAEAIITDLLETVITKSDYPLKLSKLEGDAAFLYAILDGSDHEAAQEILRQVEAFMDAFRARERILIGCITCQCEACQSIDRLKLKAFLHVGEAVIKQVLQFEELAGEDVILIHRLLKNTIPADEYVLLTDSFYEMSDGFKERIPESRSETYEGIGEIPVKVYYPSAEGFHEVASSPEKLNLAAETAVIEKRIKLHVVDRIMGRAPRRKFTHLKMRLSPGNLWEFIKGALGHAREIVTLARER